MIRRRFSPHVQRLCIQKIIEAPFRQANRVQGELRANAICQDLILGAFALVAHIAPGVSFFKTHKHSLRAVVEYHQRIASVHREHEGPIVVG